MARYRIEYLDDDAPTRMSASAGDVESALNAAVQLLLYYGMDGSVEVYDTEEDCRAYLLTCTAY